MILIKCTAHQLLFKEKKGIRGISYTYTNLIVKRRDFVGKAQDRWCFARYRGRRHLPEVNSRLSVPVIYFRCWPTPKTYPRREESNYRLLFALVRRDIYSFVAEVSPSRGRLTRANDAKELRSLDFVAVPLAQCSPFSFLIVARFRTALVPFLLW